MINNITASQMGCDTIPVAIMILYPVLNTNEFFYIGYQAPFFKNNPSYETIFYEGNTMEKN